MDRSGARTNPKFKNFALPPAKYISADALYAQDQNKIGDMAWFFHLNPDHDGLAPYRKISCPTLVTYGGLDYMVPVEESVRLLAGVIAESGRRNLKVEVIPGCGHGYGMVQEKAPLSPVMPRTVSLAYYETIREWLMDNGIVK
jgi:pimeloyl-ACP methyl ester carboxylesterase